MTAGAGCAGVGGSPRAPYAVPATVMSSSTGDSVENPASATPPELPVADDAGALDVRSIAPPSDVAAPALADGRIGLFDAKQFELATGSDCANCAVPAAALWWFRDEPIAVPRSQRAEPLPSTVWIGAPQRIEDARLSSDARSIRFGERSLPLALTRPLPTNAAYADASTAQYFSERPMSVRGAVSTASGEPRFVARTLFPKDQRIDLAALRPRPLRANELLGTLIEAQTDERYRLLLARSDPSGWAGLPVIALVLSGAQGDDDGSHAGHLAVATGVIGARGDFDSWLVTNFYPLLEGNAKGIIPASLPMDNYLYDLNSGQLYYRPGYMLVAILARPRAALAVQRALQDTMLDLHCGRIEFDRARNNSTAMTIDPLRDAGWRIPSVGPTSRAAGIVAAPVATVVRRSFRVGGSVLATFAAERTRLLPRVAFEVAGHDLLQLAAPSHDAPSAGAGTSSAPLEDGNLTPLERVLAEDIEGLLFMRLPQVPSARRFGTYPMPSLWAYGAGLLSDPGAYEPAPEAEDREFPDSLRGSCDGE